MTNEPAADTDNRSRRQLGMILLIAGLSLAGAYLLFLAVRDGGGWGTTNRGTFVTPATTVSNLDIRDESGASADTGGVWWLWVVTDSPCAAECQQALHQLRQLHILLNKDTRRVRRALVTAAAAQAPELLGGFPALELFTGSLSGLASGIYIVDPIGNLVLWYPFADAGEPVLDDLKRLLKVSQIG